MPDEMPAVGDIAPDFTLPDQSGDYVRLSTLRGKRVVLFFYPKADTPGCTTEACGFRDMREDFDAHGAVLLGLSPDTSEAQANFAIKFGLPMRLLADADHAVAESYGVWGERNLYGKKYLGIARTTFVLAPDGTIARVFRRVRPDGHAREVLDTLQTLPPSVDITSEVAL